MDVVSFFNLPAFERKYEILWQDEVAAEQAVMSELFQLFGDASTIIHDLIRVYKDLPYHNLRHAMLVAGMSLYLYRTGDVPNEASDLKSLLMAALYHDANHSGGELSDRDNIKRACAALNRFAGAHPHIKFDAAKSCRIISCTEFREGDFPKQPSDHLQMIIRDADLLASFDSSSFPFQLLALKREIGFPQEGLELVRQNIKFLSSCTFYTDVGASIFDAFARTVSKALDTVKEKHRE